MSYPNQSTDNAFGALPFCYTAGAEASGTTGFKNASGLEEAIVGSKG